MTAKRKEVMWRINRICSAVSDETLEQLERIMLAYINGTAQKRRSVIRTNGNKSEIKEMKR